MPINQFVSPLDESDELNFESLMAQGLEIIQNLAGENWSDYNLHDPGVTLLEQLCFVLTDITYRSDADIIQYFINEHGKLDLSHQGLYGPIKVLSSGPVNANDLEVLVLSHISGVSRIFLNPNTKHFGEYLLDDELSVSQRSHIKQSIHKLYHANRLICSPDKVDFDEVQPNSIELSGIIEVERGFSASDVLSDVLFIAQDYIAPTLGFTPYDDVLAQGVSMDSVLDGPFSAKGILKQSDKKTLLISDLVEKILNISGVNSVKNLQFIIDSNASKTLIETDHNCSYVLHIPDSESQLTLWQNNAQIRLDPMVLAENIQRRRLKYQKKSVSMKSHPDIFPVIEREYWSFNDSYPIFQQLPANYSGSANAQSSMEKHQKAQVRQLHSYLMLFEQFVANSFSQLSQIRHLFSLDYGVTSSYFSQPIEHEQARNLYVKQESEQQQALNQIVAKNDDYLDRRNRILDHLLALYAETFPDEMLRKFDAALSSESLSKELIRAKIAMLKHIPEIGYRRMLGQDMSKPLGWDSPSSEKSLSGLELKTRLMMGLWEIRPRSLLNVYQTLNLKLVETNQVAPSLLTISDLLGDKASIDQYVREYFRPAILDAAYGYQTLERLQLSGAHKRLESLGLFKHGLQEDFLCLGIEAGRYRIGITNKSDCVMLVFKSEKNDWVKLFSFDFKDNQSKQKAIKKAKQLAVDCQQYLYAVNRLGEGMHVLEHDLLLPDQKPCYQLSVILPQWLARFKSQDFRNFSQNLLEKNAPAHILSHIHWLDIKTMRVFEALYSQWYQCSYEEHLEKEAKAEALMQFLNELRNGNQFNNKESR